MNFQLVSDTNESIMSRLDYVIFGATGFTGEFVAKDIASNHPNATFAIAGRTQAKLDKVNAQLSRKASKTIIANVTDQESLVKMAASAKVLINCVGPFRFYGLPIVEAAVEAGTNYCDISGEPWFIEKAEYEFNDQAKEKNIYIVSACGFDSIPSDMGVEFTRNEFSKKFPTDKLNSIEAYMRVNSGSAGYTGHATTLECAVHGFSSIGDLIKLRKQAKSKNPEIIPPVGQKLRPKKSFHPQPGNPSRASLPFPGSDRSIVKRSQQKIAQNTEFNAIDFFIYFTIANTLMGKFKSAVFGGMFNTFVKFSFGRKMIIKYPGLFTGGGFSHAGPNEEQRKQTNFQFEFYGKGVNSDNKIQTKLFCKHDPGYEATAAMLTSCASVILNEGDKMPGNGGVMTTAYAFKDTTIFEKLEQRDLEFTVVG